MKFTTSQTSFKSGRLSKKLFNRIDTKQYKDGASEMQKFRVLPEGGAEVIKGYRALYMQNWVNPNIAFNGEMKNSPKQKAFSFVARGISFSAVLYTATTAGVNPEVTVLALHRYPYAYVLDDYLVIDQDTSVRDVMGWDWTVFDNELVLTHSSGEVAPLFISFPFGGGAASLSTKLFAPFGLPMLPYNKNPANEIAIGNRNVGAGTVDIVGLNAETVTALQGSSLIYAEGLGSIDPGDGNKRKAIGSNYYIVANTIVGGVTANYYSAVIDPIQEFLDALQINITNLWAVNDWGVGNWPRSVTTHEGRLVFGGTPNSPTTIYGSAAGDPYNFNQVRLRDPQTEWIQQNSPSGPVIITDPYRFTLAGNEDSEISWLNSQDGLVIGTDRGELIATGGDTILSALSVSINKTTSNGGAPAISASGAGNVFYISADRTRLHQYHWSKANGSFISTELSLLFNDLIEGDQIRDITWAAHIHSLMIVMDSGNFYGITVNKQSDTVAFYETGLTNVECATYAIAKTVLTAPTMHDRGDHIFLVRNDVGPCTFEDSFHEKGVAQSYIKDETSEKNAYLFWDKVSGVSKVAAFSYIVGDVFLAAGSTDNYPLILETYPTASTVFLENQDTGVIVEWTVGAQDGGNNFSLVDHPDINGASAIIVGTTPEAEAILATMPVEAGAQWGSAQMGIKNIDTLGIRHYKSYSYEISSDGITWQEVRVADKLGKPTTGKKETAFSSNPKLDQIVWIRQIKGEPLTVVGINMKGLSNDG